MKGKAQNEHNCYCGTFYRQQFMEAFRRLRNTMGSHGTIWRNNASAWLGKYLEIYSYMYSIGEACSHITVKISSAAEVRQQSGHVIMYISIEYVSRKYVDHAGILGIICAKLLLFTGKSTVFQYNITYRKDTPNVLSFLQHILK